MNIKTGILILILCIFISNCTTSNPSTPLPQPTDTQPPPTAEPPSIPATATPEAPPPPTNTPEPVVLQAEVNAARLNMRTGPSILHDILNQYEQGDPVTLIGAAPGREWLKVVAKDGKTGWMLYAHIKLEGEVSLLPILPISESLTAVGKVVDASGKGIPGVQIGLTRVGGAEVVRVEGISLQDGSIYIYAPVEYQGTWLANVLGVACDSPIVDNNCRFAGKFSPAEGIKLKLPQDTEILFTYQ